MRFLLMSMLFLSFIMTANPAGAAHFMDKVKFPKDTITLGSPDSPSLNVNFNHTSHKDVACDFCHHKPRCGICHYSQALDKSPSSSCSTAEGCHMEVGKSQEPASRFMAFHKKNSTRSCMGCHRSHQVEFPQFSGCKPCHPNPNAMK